MFESKVLSAVKGEGEIVSELKLMAGIAKELGANAQQQVDVSMEQFVSVLCKMGFPPEKAKQAAPHFEGRYLCARPRWYDVFGFARSAYLKFTPHYAAGPEERHDGYFVTIEKI